MSGMQAGFDITCEERIAAFQKAYNIMSGKLLVICHCECNEVEGSNRKTFRIASLRRRYANGNAKGERNDNCLTGHDITGSPRDVVMQRLLLDYSSCQQPVAMKKKIGVILLFPRLNCLD
ncbi:hypothetical protein CDG79_09520 [Nostoc sp. 'Peltigera membranacea cyanobiont' 232]|nr:hypothetical protein CDG79_09520 [Nostoc sp. 'Peltigera membranacea cyanobiont' 232]